MTKLTGFAWYSQLDEQIKNVEVLDCGTYFHIVAHTGSIGHSSFNIFEDDEKYKEIKQVENEEQLIQYVQAVLDKRDSAVLELFQ